MGGLGNQLFQYAFSLRLATESGGSVVLDPNLGTIRLNGEGNPELSSFQINLGFSPVDYKSSSNFAKRLVGLLVRSHLTAPSFLVRLFNFLLTIFANLVLSIHYREIIRLHVSTDAGYNSVDFRKNLFIGYFQTYSYSNPEIEGEIMQKITPRNLGKGYLELVKKASEYAEKAKVAIRQVRKLFLDDLKAIQKNKLISEDDFNRESESFEKIVKLTITEIDNILSAKSKDMMQL
jgi:hypothetical protein